MKLVHKVNIENKIRDVKSSLIAEVIASRNSQIQCGYNFEVFTMYREYLYNIFIDYSKEFLSKFTLTDIDHKVWCYYSDTVSYTHLTLPTKA